MTGYRKQRVGDELLAFLAQEILRLNDPRLKLLTLTSLEISPDLKSARVYWALLPTPAAEGSTADRNKIPEAEEQKKNNTAKALQGAEGLLKKRIGQELKLRYVPALHFIYDDSAENGSRIDALLKQAGF